MQEQPIVIWGAGAMGGTIAAYLIRAKKPVILVDNNPVHVNEINLNGLKISGPIDNITVTAKAFLPEHLNSHFSKPFDTIFLCTKALHTESACYMIAPFLDEDGCVLSVQNGLNELTISKILGEKRTVGCFVNFGADILEAGHIHYAGRGAVVVGELSGQNTERLQKLHALMQLFEPNAITTDKIFSFLWGKLAYGALLFASALTNESIVDILAAPQYRNVLIALGKEVCCVAKALNIPLEGFNGFEPLAFMANSSIEESEKSMDAMVKFNQNSAKTHSGIWRDLAIHKRKTEVNQQLGVIVEKAKEVGVPTPLLKAIISGITAIEDGQPLSLKNLDRVAALVN
ncbi:ketopantoate reductase family protein [Thorsellia kenyensis]|uniref:2-dehydropantoate 2-reductase n=1 Tax=Thorsellia kenyensis TaxID=1549888 RepID=A0ABV6CB24_9GAMM